MEYPVTLTTLVRSTEERTFDLEDLAKNTLVGADTITFVSTYPNYDGWQYCLIQLQCREQPECYRFVFDAALAPTIEYNNERAIWLDSVDSAPGENDGIDGYYEDDTVVEVGTEGNCDLTLRMLRALAYEIGCAVMGVEKGW